MYPVQVSRAVEVPAATDFVLLWARRTIDCVNDAAESSQRLVVVRIRPVRRYSVPPLIQGLSRSEGTQVAGIVRRTSPDAAVRPDTIDIIVANDISLPPAILAVDSAAMRDDVAGFALLLERLGFAVRSSGLSVELIGVDCSESGTLADSRPGASDCNHQVRPLHGSIRPRRGALGGAVMTGAPGARQITHGGVAA